MFRFPRFRLPGLRFTLRDLFWATLVAALGLGWWVHVRQMRAELAATQSDLLYQADYVDQFVSCFKNIGCEIPPDSDPRVTQTNLARTAVADKRDLAMCLLLPERFERYLTEVYFANFRPEDAAIAVSRNSVGHGVASVGDFNQISAAIGLLIVRSCFTAWCGHNRMWLHQQKSPMPAIRAYLKASVEVRPRKLVRCLAALKQQSHSEWRPRK